MAQPETVWYVSPQYTITINDARPTRADALGSLPEVLERLARHVRGIGEREGTVVLSLEAARRLALDKPPVDGAQYALRHAETKGWKHTSWGAFTSFYRGQGQHKIDVHVGQEELLVESGPDGWPWGFREYPALDTWGRRPLVDAVAGMQHWHRITRTAWQAGPPVMGLMLMRRHMPDYRVKRGDRSRQLEVALHDDNTPPEAGEAVWAPSMWSNPQAFPWAHGYDRRRAGLTAAGSAKLAVDRLTRGWRKFDGSRAGWWLISVPAWNRRDLPHPAGPLPVFERAWVTTATMDLLAEVAQRGELVMPEVIDSLTAPARQLLHPWQQMMEGWYATEQSPEYDEIDQTMMRDALAVVAKAGIGMLAHRNPRTGVTGSIYRPDWAHAIAATKRANGWRKLARIDMQEHRTPLWLDDDCAWYGSDLPDRVAACPRELNITDDRPGNYRAKYTKELTPA